ncbi:MAG: hypothetical protein M3Y58_10065 [Chloroflexota bacterium]|nr:hypothetical protein [Chloroflexota bacterium]
MQSPFTPSSARRLTRARYRRRRDACVTPPQPPGGADFSLYVEEAVTRRIVEDVVEEVREMRDRMTNLLFLIAGSVLVDILMRMRGG